MFILQTPLIAVFILLLCTSFLLLYNFNSTSHSVVFISSILVVLHSSGSLVYCVRSHKNYCPLFSVESLFVMDNFSVLMYFLTSIIFMFCFYYIAGTQVRTYYWYIVLLVLEILTILAFTTTNLFMFIVFFEIIIIPMYILIFVFGSRGRRVHASYYFFFYTLLSSVFLFMGLFYVYDAAGTFDYLAIQHLDCSDQFNIALLFFLGFAAKVPVCPFHIWLPEAHVESPTVGSVILASLLLKLGLYGIIRIVVLVPDGCESIRHFVWTIAVVSMYYSTMAAVRSVDLKKIIAYSSIVHMNLSLAAVFACNSIGIYAGYLSMFAHAFTSAALFFCAGMLYDRIKTRNVLYMAGQEMVYMRWFQRLFFFSVLSNMGAPLTCNFIAEILEYLAIASVNWVYAIVLVFNMLVLTAFYNLILLYRVLYSKSVYFNDVIEQLDGPLQDLTRTEITCLSLLLLYSIIFGLNPDAMGRSFWPWI